MTGAVNQVYPGGLPGLLQKMQESGYGAQVSSWLGHGPNDPIERVRTSTRCSAITYVQQLEQHFGLPEGQISNVLASKALPTAVDSAEQQRPAAPAGHLPGAAAIAGADAAGELSRRRKRETAAG